MHYRNGIICCCMIYCFVHLAFKKDHHLKCFFLFLFILLSSYQTFHFACIFEHLVYFMEVRFFRFHIYVVSYLCCVGLADQYLWPLEQDH